VVTAVLNGVETLPKNLASIHKRESAFSINQIVIDGGSTDGTIELVGDMQRHSPNLYLYNNPVKGISKAFNQGLSEADGQFVSFLNSDDRYLDGALDRALSRIASDMPEADVYYGDIVYEDVCSGYAYEEIADLESIAKYMSVYHPSMLFRTEALHKLAGYRTDYALAMDAELIHRALRAGYRFAYLDFPIAVMRLGGVSHREYGRALVEYRRSLLENDLQLAFKANYYLVRQLIVHTILNISNVRKFRATRNRLR